LNLCERSEFEAWFDRLTSLKRGVTQVACNPGLQEACSGMWLVLFSYEPSVQFCVGSRILMNMSDKRENTQTDDTSFF
jgi:hypothetical protein